MTHHFKIVSRAPEEQGKELSFRDPLRGMDCQFFLDGRELHTVGVKLDFSPGRELVKAVIEICPSELDIELDGALTTLVFKEAADISGREVLHKLAIEDMKIQDRLREANNKRGYKDKTFKSDFAEALCSPEAYQERERQKREFEENVLRGQGINPIPANYSELDNIEEITNAQIESIKQQVEILKENMTELLKLQNDLLQQQQRRQIEADNRLNALYRDRSVIKQPSDIGKGNSHPGVIAFDTWG